MKFTKEGGKIVIRLKFSLAEPRDVASLSADARAAAAKAVAEAKQAAALAALNTSPLSSSPLSDEAAGSKPPAATTPAPDASPSASAAASAAPGSAAAVSASAVVSDGSELPTILFHLSVIDDGIGVSLDEQAKLFQPFVQLSAGTSQQKGKGSGLGLSISRNLILLHGGSIGYRAPKVVDVLPFSPTINEEDLHSTGSPVERQQASAASSTSSSTGGSGGAAHGSSATVSRSASASSSSAEATPSPSSTTVTKRASEFWMKVPMQVLPMPPRATPAVMLPPALVAHHTKHRSFDARAGADNTAENSKGVPVRADIQRSLHALSNAAGNSGSGTSSNSRSLPTTPPSPVCPVPGFLEDTRAAAEFYQASSMLDAANSVLYNPSPATTDQLSSRSLAVQPPARTSTPGAVPPSSRSGLSHSQSMQLAAGGNWNPVSGASAAAVHANAQLQSVTNASSVGSGSDSLQSANRPPRSPFSVVRRLPLPVGHASARESTSFARSTDGSRGFDAIVSPQHQHHPQLSPPSSAPASAPVPLTVSAAVEPALAVPSSSTPAPAQSASASPAGVGSVVSVSASPPSRPTGAVPASAPLLSRILVVEDSLPNLKLLCMMVRSLRYEVEGVEHGGLCVQRFEEALAAAGEAGCAGPTPDGSRSHGWPFDALLLDGSMPVLNGPQTARRLRALGVQVPIIACTGNALADDVEDFLQAGATCVLTKVSPGTARWRLAAREAH